MPRFRPLLDRPTEAAKALAKIDEPAFAAKAKAFGTLLGRDEIVVFLTGALIPIFAEQHSPSVLAPVHRYGPITTKYVASQMAENAYKYSPAEPFDEFIDALPARERPDLLFALSPQWLLAKNFHKVKQPKVVWCHDTDAFLYRNRDNFALYDVAIAGCSQEHFELSRGASVFCASNLMSNPLNMPAPKVSAPTVKDIDVVFTGSAFDASHPEKARFLYQLAELGADYNVKIVNGYLPEKDYFALLRRSKFMPAVGRHAGNTSPRWRDALANGALLLYPEGTLYGEAVPGCLPYRAGAGAAAIRRHLKRFDAGDPAYDPSRIVPEVNARCAIHPKSRQKIFERLLKYAVFMALVWRQGQTVAKDAARRLVWLTPEV